MKVVLAGTGSAVGKTTISTGIMKALSDENVQPFKVGPDFIDPSYHTIATGNVSRNLDSFFMTDFQIINSFERALKKSNSNMGIIEGVRGLYEGISPIGDVGNTASIAKAIDAPVVLLMDARSLVKSAAAVVLGFKALDPDVRIEGVILNKVKGQRHYKKAKESVEKLADVPVIGGIPRDDKITVEERHLGLVPALEKERITRNINLWGEIAEEYIDLDALKDIMKTSSKSTARDNKNIAMEKHEDDFNREHTEAIDLEVTNDSKPGQLWKTGNRNKVKIGVAQDEIFTFYYKETLESLEENSAEIVPFSPLKDEHLPDVDALYIGGGYPEVFKKELSDNKTMLNDINKFHKENRPIYGECGGLIYLSKSIDGLDMVGAVPYSSEMTNKVQGLNYVVARANQDNLISNEGDVFRAHEFHYTKLNIDKTDSLVFDVLRGRGVLNNMDGVCVNNTLANYIHIHACSHPNFGYNFTINISELDI
ncbi:cobyrinic acid a,c-diamide synthase CbiA4 [Methanobrevibacter ruminantium M1]|uniref:Cobyrinate a,c-diamide synthase n=1 Tax=Methanobrevibacter ruminantium (strain ATCC 35063 / DSM 1093 / JCM 13430 / OCM 146 / M1) TaxID=634498 RepID=D3E1B6_METRM|nr:Ni-sirohydrochlorin a,c-diamide synthase [Methanobrevibacter ruminantium]ADC48001.1 cobyrinic acid a,c-diamide synthase CbiA4 [Methanobrevibacter ruminantium M1]